MVLSVRQRDDRGEVMAKDEAKVRVRLDTRQAEGELGQLTREGERTAGRIGSGMRSSIGRGAALLGLGGALGLGLASIKRDVTAPTTSGFMDFAGEVFGEVGGALAHAAGAAGLGAHAKGAARARAEAMNAFGVIAGETGAIPPGARGWFNQVRDMRVKEELGRNMLEREFRGGGGAIRSVVDPIIVGVAVEMIKVVNSVKEFLMPWMLRSMGAR